MKRKIKTLCRWAILLKDNDNAYFIIRNNYGTETYNYIQSNGQSLTLNFDIITVMHIINEVCSSGYSF